MQPFPSGASRCLFVTTEMADFIKAGGLGDVAAALPRALNKSSDVRVLLPGYPAVLRQARALRVVGHVVGQGGIPDTELGQLTLPDGLHVYVVLCPALFDRPGSPYGSELGQEWEDNACRFGALSWAAAAIAQGRAGLAWKPDLLHLNDWPGALAAAYLAWEGAATPCLLTIHNLAYQGLFPLSMAPLLGIPPQGVAEMDFYGQLSFLKAGLTHAHHLNTVSITYARQITQPGQGCGLEPLLTQRAQEGRLTGIVNGIDGSWDPRCDPHLASGFSVANRSGRAANTQAVRRFFGLPTRPGPVFCVVSRLVHQKGLDLTCELVPQIASAGGQIVVMGGGEPHIEAQVKQLQWDYPQHVGVYIGFDEKVARQMFAGSDFLLMPSRFEPCGLSQMYAQRFGSLPIAHGTGGLLDTVDDGVTGFLFHTATTDALRRCVVRALRTFQNPGLFHAMQQAAMLRPQGWQEAGKDYLTLYRQACMLAN